MGSIVEAHIRAACATMPLSFVLTEVKRFVSANHAAPFLESNVPGFYIDEKDPRVQLALAQLRSGAASSNVHTFLYADEDMDIAFEASLRWDGVLRGMQAGSVPCAYSTALGAACQNFFFSGRVADAASLVRRVEEVFRADSVVGCVEPVTGACHVLVVQQTPRALVDVLALVITKCHVAHATVVAVPRAAYDGAEAGPSAALLARRHVRAVRLRTGAVDILRSEAAADDEACSVCEAAPSGAYAGHVLVGGT